MPENKRVLFVATVVKQHIAEFHLPAIKMLSENGWTVDVAAHNDYDNPEDCVIPHCSRFYDLPITRSPLTKKNVEAYKQLKAIIKDGNYDVVHCHTPVGSVIARLAAKRYRKTGLRVFYTAHGFHFYKGAPAKNWLFFFPVEWICAHWTDVLITITKEDFKRAKNSLPAKKVQYIPGVGININKFANTKIDRSKKRKEIGVPEGAYLVLSVGELNINKNHEIVIREIAKIMNGEISNLYFLNGLENREIHYAIAGRGELADYLKQVSESLKIGDRLHLLGYRSDCNELYKAADLFVLPSLREGLNVSLQEARASGIECRCFPIRGNKEIMEATDMHVFDQTAVCETMLDIYNDF